MKRVVCLLAAAVLLAASMGCASSEPPFLSDRPILVFPQPENTFEEDVSARQPYAEYPAWLHHPESYANKRPGCIYFVGIGLPKTTLPEARDSAVEDAERQIVRYMGTTVGVKTEHAGTAAGGTRGSYEEVTDHIFSDTLAHGTIEKLYVRDHFYTAGMLVQNIAKRRVNVAYVLVEFGPGQAADVAQQARETAETEIRQIEQKRSTAPEQKLDDRDQIRLDSLKKLEQKLETLSADDFKL